MSRKAAATKRFIEPDTKYNNKLISQLINQILQAGKKSIAEKTVYGAFEMIEEKSGNDPVAVYKKAIDNIRPQLEVKSRRVGGATYQVPIEVSGRRATTLALRWLVTYTKERREKRMSERLAAEIMEAADQQGGAIKKREDVHKMAEANRAFAHYRW